MKKLLHYNEIDELYNNSEISFVINGHNVCVCE